MENVSSMPRRDRHTEEWRQGRRNALPNIFEDPAKDMEEDLQDERNKRNNSIDESQQET